ncbi:MAG: NAD-glutamate dehydrogenase, partial [Pseudomonadota bacterium]
NRDKPFLVDSVMNALLEAEAEVTLLLHPVFEVSRSDSGDVVSVTATNIGADATANPGSERESVIIVGVSNMTPDQADRIIRELQATITDVTAAVRDWRDMLNRFETAVAALEATSTAAEPDRKAEAVAFAKWLLDGQFVFLGLREYRLIGDAETGELEAVPGGSLGVLQDPHVQVLRRGTEMVALTPEIRSFYFGPQPIFVTKSNVISRVHRSVHMDYIGLKTYEADGRLKGEMRLVGLFTSKAYTMPPAEIPLLRRKAALVTAQSGYVAGSHDAKALVNVLDTFPRDELFQIPVDLLSHWAPQIVDLETRPRTRVFARLDRFNRFVSALVYLSRERFSTVTRERIGDILAERFGGSVVMFQPYFTDGRLVRVHFIIGRFEGRQPNDVDFNRLQDDIADVARSWRDRLANAIALKSDTADSADGMAGISTRYCSAFPSSYTESHTVDRGLIDAQRIDALAELEPVDVRLYREDQGPLADATSLEIQSKGSLGAVIYSLHGPIPLSERVPAFEDMGFRVIDERSHQVRPPGRLVELHDMRIEPNGLAADQLSNDGLARIEAGYRAIQAGHAESDNFNALMATAGLDWRQAAILRAYGLYLRQTGIPLGPRYMATTLAGFPDIASHLAQLFDVRFNPDFSGTAEDRAQREAAIVSEVEAALADVPSLDQDRIIRAYLNLITATVRTNVYQTSADGSPAPTIAFKFDADKVAAIPAPKPYREIWVYSPRVEGVHLRFAPIARGGLRWSDRAQDFRTEVLGLAKAQQVKNTVIVPEGAKGGFFPKKLPVGGNREAFIAEGVNAYRTFIGAMIDITDNIVDGALVPPDRVVRHDGDDPYLVVAADKGTATFSDYANTLSLEKGHWLGDAFASGGSAGYDHKKMGITARGAWECVKRHFREMDHDIQTVPFSAIGVGDMSGDVFGNGMLLSPVTRLIAAFDHRDIFIDPDPDTAASFAERKRLFDLGRSSWQDYNTSHISTGGGVFSRAAKSISVSPEIQSALGITSSEMTPNALMKAILQAPVDLLWFGGIGTYVRAPDESDLDVGDRANDPIRITSDDLRVRVIGEGANLGVTQASRVAFGLRGGRLNTDFIDNSAGVNSSDLEVNIKIACKGAIDAGALAADDRNALLERMTDDVAASCLRNNEQQALAISLVERDGLPRLCYLQRFMRALEQGGVLNRELEGLPSDQEIAERVAIGQGLVRSEIAVLLSYAKIALSANLMNSQLAEDKALEPLLFDYFPNEMSENLPDAIQSHQLRKEILVTRITNSIINRGGPSLIVRLADETGRTVGEIAKSIMATRDIFALPDLWAQIETLGFDVSGRTQLNLLAATQAHLIDQTTASLRSGEVADLNQMIATDKPTVDLVRSGLTAGLATESQIADLTRAIDGLMTDGVPETLARAVCELPLVRYGPLIRRLSSATGADAETAATAVFGIVDAFHILSLGRAAEAAAITDYYDRLAMSSAFAAIEKAVFDAARSRILKSTNADTRIARAADDLCDMATAGGISVSRLTVVASQVRDLMQA